MISYKILLLAISNKLFTIFCCVIADHIIIITIVAIYIDSGHADQVEDEDNSISSSDSYAYACCMQLSTFGYMKNMLLLN